MFATFAKDKDFEYEKKWPIGVSIREITLTCPYTVYQYNRQEGLVSHI